MALRTEGANRPTTRPGGRLSMSARRRHRRTGSRRLRGADQMTTGGASAHPSADVLRDGDPYAIVVDRGRLQPGIAGFVDASRANTA
jgi:hypothetical protein